MKSFRLIQLPVKDRANFGDWLNVMWDDKAATAVVGAEPMTVINGYRRHGFHLLAADACRDTVVSAIRLAKDKGALITYDPNYRASLWSGEEEARAQMRAVLPLCDIVKISEEETEMLTGSEAPEEAAEALIRQGVRLVIVTLGANGAYWRYGKDSGTVPGFRVKVADTNGAGDTFFGAFLSRIAKHGGIGDLTPERIERYVRYANRAASITASRPGAIPAMPTEDELTEE